MGNLKNHYLILIITTTICLFLLSGRIYVSGNWNFIFLVWNLFLAWIPLYFSNKMRIALREKNMWSTAMLFICWLVIFPNAPYLLTDLIHLKQHSGVPLWFDLVLLVSFGWCGLLLGFISLMEVHQTILTRFSEKQSWGIISIIFMLTGYGIYLGRFERWNSWDILFHPFRLFGQIIANFQNQETLLRIIGVSCSFALFLMFSYGTIYYLSRKEEKG